MGIHSYTQPSTSSGSGRGDSSRNVIKEYGLMEECHCGARAIIDTCRSRIDPGRRFFSCPNAGNGECHIWTWWDEAVMEELCLIHIYTGDVAEKMDLFMAKGEIEVLHNAQVETAQKIANLEMELAVMKKKKSGIAMRFEMHITIAAAVVFF
ncbi:unnamed protein product [Thlaspi arvense]|uniref:GRF-type domain-containing protein n=1 Tax=Thlaspi arvense TaxID=13288 RepID=A0AAU9T490_THLAR|nr:unnamed protein product [Thlaspi arvense]